MNQDINLYQNIRYKALRRGNEYIAYRATLHCYTLLHRSILSRWKKNQYLFELDIFPPALLTTQQKGKKVRNEGRIIIIVRSGENSHNFNWSVLSWGLVDFIKLFSCMNFILNNIRIFVDRFVIFFFLYCL